MTAEQHPLLRPFLQIGATFTNLRDANGALVKCHCRCGTVEVTQAWDLRPHWRSNLFGGVGASTQASAPIKHLLIRLIELPHYRVRFLERATKTVGRRTATSGVSLDERVEPRIETEGGVVPSVPGTRTVCHHEELQRFVDEGVLPASMRSRDLTVWPRSAG